MTNLHQATNEEPIWERLNLWDRIAEVQPNMGLSDADRILLGPLAEIKTYSDHPSEIIIHLYECTKRMSHADPMARLKSLCGLDRAYEILIDAGFDSFRPQREQMQIGLKRFTAMALRSLTRTMLETDDDERAEEISGYLLELISTGRWTQAEFSAEFESWVAEMQARRAC
jgi:hypothetical protein